MCSDQIRTSGLLLHFCSAISHSPGNLSAAVGAETQCRDRLNEKAAARGIVCRPAAYDTTLAAPNINATNICSLHWMRSASNQNTSPISACEWSATTSSADFVSADNMKPMEFHYSYTGFITVTQENKKYRTAADRLETFAISSAKCRVL